MFKVMEIILNRRKKLVEKSREPYNGHQEMTHGINTREKMS